MAMPNRSAGEARRRALFYPLCITCAFGRCASVDVRNLLERQFLKGKAIRTRQPMLELANRGDGRGHGRTDEKLSGSKTRRLHPMHKGPVKLLKRLEKLPAFALRQPGEHISFELCDRLSATGKHFLSLMREFEEMGPPIFGVGQG